MAIEFHCPSCRTLIRTAEGTEGRPARCPQCTAVVEVPTTQQATALPPAQPFSDPLPSSPFVQPTATRPTDEPKPDMAAPLNPYATPANPFAHDPFQPLSGEELARWATPRLLWPAIGMFAFALFGLGLMALVGLVFAMDPDALFRNVDQDPAQRAGAMSFFIAYFLVGFTTRALQMLGAIAMIRQRGYSLALAGAVSALIPCEIYCCLPSLPLGIWALIVLNNAQVKAAFKQ